MIESTPESGKEELETRGLTTNEEALDIVNQMNKEIEKANPTPDWRERFDYMTNSNNFEVGADGLSGEHLFDSDWYPESPYELSSDKIKSFIEQTIKSEHNRAIDMAVEEVELLIPAQPYPNVNNGYQEELEGLEKNDNNLLQLLKINLLKLKE